MIRVRVFQIGRWAIPFLCEEIVEPGLQYLGTVDLTRDELEAWLFMIEAEAGAALGQPGVGF